MTDAGRREALLVDAILADAAVEAAALVARAREQAQAVRAEAEVEARAATSRQLELARLEAERRRAVILATVRIEEKRLALRTLDRLLEELVQHARRRLLALDRPERLEVTVRLAADAIGRTDGDRFVVRVSSAELGSSGPELLNAIATLTPLSSIDLVPSPELVGPGPCIYSSDGRRVWDNRLVERLARLWPALRPQVAARLQRPAGAGAPEAGT